VLNSAGFGALAGRYIHLGYFLIDYVSVPIVHILTECVNGHKFLVDMQPTAGVAQEHCQNNFDGFMLADSDFDSWSLCEFRHVSTTCTEK
jgi:hypothetical protein